MGGGVGGGAVDMGHGTIYRVWLASPGMRANVPLKPIGNKVVALKGKILKYEFARRLRTFQKSGKHRAVSEKGVYLREKSAHADATQAVKESQDSLRTSGGAIQLIAEDATATLIGEGSTRLSSGFRRDP